MAQDLVKEGIGRASGEFVGYSPSELMLDTNRRKSLSETRSHIGSPNDINLVYSETGKQMFYSGPAKYVLLPGFEPTGTKAGVVVSVKAQTPEGFCG